MISKQAAEKEVIPTIRLKAMNLMARREYSRRELEIRLSQKFEEYPEPVIKVLNRLERDGLLSDERFTEVYIRGSIRKGRGPKRIKRELLDKGISEAMASEKLANTDIDWFAQASEVFSKKFANFGKGNLSASEGLKLKAKQSRFMQYRGFDFEHIKHCLKESSH